MKLFIDRVLSLSDDDFQSFISKLFVYLLIATLVTTYFGSFYFGYINHNSWTVGDWLINYQGGLIRRGLLGEFFYKMWQFFYIPLWVSVFFIQSLCYTVFFICSYLLLKRKKLITNYITIIFSPVVFTFQINDIGGGYRKEILYIAVFSFIIYSASFFEEKKFKLVFYIILLLYPVLIMSHEMLFFFLPYFLMVPLTLLTISKKEAGKLILLSLPSIASFIFVAYLGAAGTTSSQISNIYESIEKTGYHIQRGGAISYLKDTPDNLVKMTTEKIKNNYYLSYYFQALVFSLLPFVFIRRNFSLLKQKKNFFLLILIAIFNVILFTLAFDWGRWIYINIVSLFLLSMLQPQVHSEKYCDNIRTKNNWKKYIILISVISYSQCWYMSHCNTKKLFILNSITSLRFINIITYGVPYYKIIENFLE